MIESWGRGIEKITTACKNDGKPEPAIEFKHNREFSVTFYSDDEITANGTENKKDATAAQRPFLFPA